MDLILNLKYIAVIAIFVVCTSCQKLVDVEPPPTQISEENVYKADKTAIGVLTGLYSKLVSSPPFLFNEVTNLSRALGLSSDELFLEPNFADAESEAYFKNELFVTSKKEVGTEIYKSGYYSVYVCNSAIEGLLRSNTLSPGVKEQLLGEAYFMRAFLYFYLENLYGRIPLALTSDYEKNRLLPNASKAEIYKQIVSDLQNAENNLNSDFLDGNLKKYTSASLRVRPTKWAAKALLARVYLFNNEWVKAEGAATEVINNSAFFSLPSLEDAFLAQSNEAIWQLQPVIINSNTEDAKAFNLGSYPEGFSSTKSVYLSDALLSSFELNDKRKDVWVGTYSDGTSMYFYPNKYKQGDNTEPGQEFLIVFRLAEQFLIRSEARAHLNNLSDAASDVNTIRDRAGLAAISVTNVDELLATILKERRHELFTEWGHRWFDLKRTGKLDEVMQHITPIKAGGNAWNPYQAVFPLPFNDVTRNPNLLQNTGY